MILRYLSYKRQVNAQMAILKHLLHVPTHSMKEDNSSYETHSMKEDSSSYEWPWMGNDSFKICVICTIFM